MPSTQYVLSSWKPTFRKTASKKKKKKRKTASSWSLVPTAQKSPVLKALVTASFSSRHARCLSGRPCTPAHRRGPVWYAGSISEQTPLTDLVCECSQTTHTRLHCLSPPSRGRTPACTHLLPGDQSLPSPFLCHACLFPVTVLRLAPLLSLLAALRSQPPRPGRPLSAALFVCPMGPVLGLNLCGRFPSPARRSAFREQPFAAHWACPRGHRPGAF